MSSSSAAESKVSFTIRRPTPASHTGSDSDSSTFKVPALPKHLSGTSTPNSPLARSTPPSPKRRTYTERDSSDEDSEAEDELVTAFDEFGAKRLHEKPKPQGPLVIPALQNRDWREMARKRKQMYVPPSAAATTGADGSVGGLGTRDTINSGPQASGLQFRKRVKLEAEEDSPMPDASTADAAHTTVEPKVEETDDQKALRAILAGAAAGDDGVDGPQIDIIPAVSEDDAYRQDVVELPDSSTLEDYERVPVSQFGAALLRGMGWKEGTAASKKHKGMVEPWLPEARPALLGIGAKEREVFDDGSKGKKGAKARPERRYVPVVKRERKSESGEPESERERDSRTGSRKSSRSPQPDLRKDRRDDHDHRKDGDRDRSDRNRDRDRDRYRDSDRNKDRYRERERNRDWDRRPDSEYAAEDWTRKDRDPDGVRRRDRPRSDDRYESSRRRDKDRY